ncbi:MAG: CarD family transcriptional regulator [Bacteroidetes bacterium]|nr:CarD family transcriptional regulator [Bacteroidota bacterium]
MNSTIKKTAFSVGEHIVYPLQGVGLIKEIEDRDFKGNSISYYIIYLDITDMTVMIPVEKAEELGIRGIVTPIESQEALDSLSSIYEPVTIDWKLRYQMNLDLLKEGTVVSIASVVQALYHRSKIKELPVQERKLFDNALKILIDEMSFSFNKDKKEIEEMIFTRLEA